MPEQRGISPVIGIILMVAITVILASIIAAFIFGMSGSSNTCETREARITVPDVVMFPADLTDETYFDVGGDQRFFIDRDKITAEQYARLDEYLIPGHTITLQISYCSGKYYVIDVIGAEGLEPTTFPA